MTATYNGVSRQSYARGVVYALLAGVFLSTAGILVRYLGDANAFTVLFYRSLAFFLTVTAFIFIRDYGQVTARYRDVKPSDIVVSVSLALGFIFYVLSLFNTTVANTALLLSTGPFFAAILGLIVLHERVDTRTWIAMIIAAAGVAVMVSGGTSGEDLWGMAYAIIAVLAFAILVVALRRVGESRDMLVPTSLAGLFAALMCVPFVPTYQITPWDLTLSLALGSIQVGAGFILITLSTRSVPAAQVPLLALGETALAPIWVWLLVNETPVRNTLLGGVLVLAAVVFQGLAGLRGRGGAQG